MAKDLGKVCFVSRGVYDETKSDYEKLDLVTFEGSCYVALKDVPAGEAPVHEDGTASTYWMEVAVGAYGAAIKGGLTRDEITETQFNENLRLVKRAGEIVDAVTAAEAATALANTAAAGATAATTECEAKTEEAKAALSAIALSGDVSSATALPLGTSDNPVTIEGKSFVTPAIQAVATKVGEIEIPTTKTGYFIDLSGTTAGEETISTSGFRYMKYPCKEGDIITVNGTGGKNGRLWAFIDSSDTILSVADASTTETGTTHIAPANSAYIIINDNTNSISYYESCKSLNEVKANKSDIEEINEKITQKEEVNIDDYNVLAHAIKSDSTWTASTLYKHTIIPVTEGEVYRITSNDAHKAQYAFLTSSSIDTTKNAPLVDGTTRYTVQDPDDDIIIPSSCLYLYITLLFPDNDDYTPKSIYKYEDKLDSIQNSVVEVYKTANENADKIADINNILHTYESKSEEGYVKSLLFTSENNTIRTYDSVKATIHYLPIEDGDKVIVTGTPSKEMSLRIGVSEVIPAEGVVVNDVVDMDVYNDGRTVSISYTAKSSGYLCYYYWNDNKYWTVLPTVKISTSVGNTVDIVKDATFLHASVSMFGKIAVIGASWDSSDIPVDADNIVDTTKISNNKIDNANYSWIANLGRRNGVKWYNFAKASCTSRLWLYGWAKYGVQKMQSADACSLYVINFVGNDSELGEDYLGTIDDIQTHPDTYYGNYSKIIELVQEKASKEKADGSKAMQAKIICSINCADNSSDVRKKFAAACREIAAYYGLPTITWNDDPMWSVVKERIKSNHPTSVYQSCIATIFERLFSKCVDENYDYFCYYYDEDAFD